MSELARPVPGLEPVLTTAELAAHLGVPVQTIHDLRPCGPRGIRVGRELRFRVSEIQARLAELEEGDAASESTGMSGDVRLSSEVARRCAQRACWLVRTNVVQARRLIVLQPVQDAVVWARKRLRRCLCRWFGHLHEPIQSRASGDAASLLLSNGGRVTKVLLVIGDGAEMTDTLYPLYRVQEEQYECLVAGPERREYHLVKHDRVPDWDITVESFGRMLQADIAFRNILSDEYAGMIISGGRAPEYLRYDQDLLLLTREMVRSGKPVASICHGIEILAAADVIRDVRVTTVAKCRLDAESAGGIYLDQAVVVDGNLVSARTYDDNPLWMREFFALMCGYEEHGRISGPLA